MRYKNMKTNWAAKSFWSMNDEMHSEYKATFVREIDATPLDLVRNNNLLAGGIRPSYTALIVHAAAQILREFPNANRAILGPFFWKRLVQFKDIDITVAIEKSIEGAEAVVLAHTIRSCESQSVAEITADLQSALKTETDRWQLFSRVLNYIPPALCKWILRSAVFFPDQWINHRGGACFVNSPAKYGVDFIIADMLWPLTFTFGQVKERPIVINGKVEARRTIPLTMIFDRRIMQGAIAARIFNRYCEILEGKLLAPAVTDPVLIAQ